MIPFNKIEHNVSNSDRTSSMIWMYIMPFKVEAYPHNIFDPLDIIYREINHCIKSKLKHRNDTKHSRTTNA